MNRRIDIVTLGASELARSISFYRDGLGLSVELEDENYVRFATGGGRFASFPRESLADDANVSSEGDGLSGITLARVVESKEEIAQILDRADAAGGLITEPAGEAEWFSGFSGPVADPDGYVWEFVAFAGLASRDHVVLVAQ